METKKSLGQHFLRDKGILKKIADFAGIKKEDVVIEVGPGEGSLTEFLLEKIKKPARLDSESVSGRVIAVEKDGKMVEFLEKKFSREIKNRELKIVEGDILSPQVQKCTDIFLLENSSCSAQSASQGISGHVDSKYLLVGNIPYYITGALFKKVLESANPPKSITFVVQKEVAERIVARDAKESILSISIKAYGKPKYGGIIKAGSFYPKPKVDSAIIHVGDISKSRFDEINETKFFEILKAGFAHKRKLLIRNLDKFEKTEKMKEIFVKYGISEKARAENLPVEKWIRLAEELQNN
jgi:16S rRNA (adenine1518-N6/adenine1519-N6)-dimethyltransferase